MRYSVRWECRVSGCCIVGGSGRGKNQSGMTESHMLLPTAKGGKLEEGAGLSPSIKD